MAIKLPTEKSKPRFDFALEKVLLYGDNGEGKTTLAANLPDSIIIATEKGQSKTSAYAIEVNTWEEYLEAIEAVKPSKYKTIIVDTLPMLYMMFLEYFKKKHQVSHEGDIKFKGYSMLAREFATEFIHLQNSGKGYWLLTNINREDVDGGKGKIIPNVPYDKDRRIWDATVGVCDYVFYLNEEMITPKDGSPTLTKVLHSKSSNEYYAKSRADLPAARLPLISGDPAGSVQRLNNAYNKTAADMAAKSTKEGAK